MKKLRIAALSALLLCLLAAVPAAALEPLGTQLPDLTLPSSGGDPVSLRELAKDKVCLLVYWSVTCPHCQNELPLLVSLNKKLAGNPFVMITISTDSPAMIPAVEAMAEDFDLPQPVLMDTADDDSLPVADYYDIVVTPTVLLHDREGRLVYSMESESDMDELMTAIKAAF